MEHRFRAPCAFAFDLAFKEPNAQRRYSSRPPDFRAANGRSHGREALGKERSALSPPCCDSPSDLTYRLVCIVAGREENKMHSCSVYWLSEKCCRYTFPCLEHKTVKFIAIAVVSTPKNSSDQRPPLHTGLFGVDIRSAGYTVHTRTQLDSEQPCFSHRRNIDSGLIANPSTNHLKIHIYHPFRLCCILANIVDDPAPAAAPSDPPISKTPLIYANKEQCATDKKETCGQQRAQQRYAPSTLASSGCASQPLRASPLTTTGDDAPCNRPRAPPAAPAASSASRCPCPSSARTGSAKSSASKVSIVCRGAWRQARSRGWLLFQVRCSAL